MSPSLCSEHFHSPLQTLVGQTKRNVVNSPLSTRPSLRFSSKACRLAVSEGLLVQACIQYLYRSSTARVVILVQFSYSTSTRAVRSLSDYSPIFRYSTIAPRARRNRACRADLFETSFEITAEAACTSLRATSDHSLTRRRYFPYSCTQYCKSTCKLDEYSFCTLHSSPLLRLVSPYMKPVAKG